jgi:hypothetical protein
MRGRCVLTEATFLLRPVRPVRPEFRCNALLHPIRPDVCCNTTSRQVHPVSHSNAPLHPDTT